MDNEPVGQIEEKQHLNFAVAAFIGFVTVLLLGIAAFAIYFFYLSEDSDVLVPVDDTVGSTAPSKDRTLQEEASRLQEELERTTSTGREAQIKRAFALANMRFDTKNSYEMFREIAKNMEYPPHERAMAVQFMGDAFLTRTSNLPDFALNYVFQEEEPYLSMGLNGENELERTWYGIRDLYAYAVSIEPLPIAQYRIAEWYLQALENDPSDPEALEQALMHYEAVNKDLDPFFSTLSNEDGHLIGQMMWLKGRVESRLFAHTGEEYYREEAVKSFDEAQRFLSLNSNPANEHELLWNRLYYAEFLMSINDEDQAASLLSAFMNSYSNSSISRYLSFLGTYEDVLLPHQRAEKERIAALGELSEEFKAVLNSHGF